MTATLTTLGIDRLTVAERIDLVQKIWDSIADESSQMSNAQREELERRADDDDANPDDVIPWEQVRDEARARWKQ